MRSTTIKFAELEDLATLVIRGFEGEDDAGGAGGSEGDAGSGDTGGDDAGGGDDSTDDSGDDDLPDDNAQLKEALRKERKANKDAQKAAKVAQREAARLKKAEDDKATAEKGEVEAATKRATDAAAKAEKLASKLRQSSLERAIIDAAQKQRFRDADDVITQLQRSNFDGIDIDQDEDDPSDIDIDLKSVERAVKKVAAAKPHWLVAAGDSGPSGSSFNGGKPSDKGGNKDAELAERFPALKGRLPRN